MLVADVVRHAAERYAEREAVVCGKYRLTYHMLIQRAARLVAGLYSRGYKPGDRIAIMGLNCHRAIELYIASAISGLVVAPMKITYPVDELHAMLERTDPILMIADARDSRKIRAVTADFPHIELLWWDDDAHEERSPYTTGGGEYEWLIRHHDSCAFSPTLQENSLFALLQTTGSTDAQKAVMITQRTQVETVLSEFTAYCFPVGTYVQSGSLLFSSGAGMTIQTLLTGGKQVLLNGDEAEHILCTIEEERADGARYLPQLVHACNSGRHNIRSLKYVIQGGYHLNPYHFQTFIEHYGPILIHSYGSTEVGGIASLTPDQYWHDGVLNEEPICSCGHALPGVTVGIVDADGHMLPPGEVGEVVVRTRALMPGYWRNPMATARAIKNGWYHTHDTGMLDEHGYLFLQPRNETPSGHPTFEALDVDTVLCRHQTVADCVTFSCPTPDGCRNIIAVVEPRASAAISLDELMSHCCRHLAVSDRPVAIYVVEHLPRNTSGKVLKRSLRERFLRDQFLPAVTTGSKQS